MAFGVGWWGIIKAESWSAKNEIPFDVSVTFEYNDWISLPNISIWKSKSKWVRHVYKYFLSMIFLPFLSPVPHLVFLS